MQGTGAEGTFHQPAQLNLHSSSLPQPAHAFSEQLYQINMILHPIYVICMAIR